MQRQGFEVIEVSDDAYRLPITLKQTNSKLAKLPGSPSHDRFGGSDRRAAAGLRRLRVCVLGRPRSHDDASHGCARACGCARVLDRPHYLAAAKHPDRVDFRPIGSISATARSGSLIERRFRQRSGKSRSQATRAWLCTTARPSRGCVRRPSSCIPTAIGALF